ncbi:MAG: addiction module protein [Deltaproteobacteria bacterium]|nr:addiction module protein [Deltaproteobacteria bacterium]MBW1872358.1 addiction module protein [Deltaproteobacteria bacterium]
MTTDELENAALKLDPKSRARLAERLLASLERLSDAENAQLWAEEAQRRDLELDKDQTLARSSEDVLRDVKSRLS